MGGRFQHDPGSTGTPYPSRAALDGIAFLPAKGDTAWYKDPASPIGVLQATWEGAKWSGGYIPGGASYAPGSPSNPFPDAAARNAWAAQNPGGLVVGLEKYGPGGVVWEWKGPLATDWVVVPELNYFQNGGIGHPFGRYPVVVVEVGAGKAFTSIIAAIASITDASANRRYEVRLTDASYTEGAQIQTKDYVDIVGAYMTRSEVTHSLPNSATEAEIEATSVINLNTHSMLSRLYVHGANVRYAVHSDGAPVNTVCGWYDCVIAHDGITATLGTWGALVGAGCGTRSGQTLFAIESEMYGSNLPKSGVATHGMSFHNYTAFSNPSKVIIKNCRIVSNGYTAGLSIQSIGSGVTDVAVLEGNLIQFGIDYNDSGWLGSPTGSRADWKLTGAWNEFLRFNNTMPSGKGDDYEFIDPSNTYRYINNGGTVTRGQILQFNDAFVTVSRGATPLVHSRFAGVALSDCSANGTLYVKKRGVVRVNINFAAATYDPVGAPASGIGSLDATNPIGYVYQAGGPGLVWVKLIPAQ